MKKRQTPKIRVSEKAHQYLKALKRANKQVGTPKPITLLASEAILNIPMPGKVETIPAQSTTTKTE